MTQIVATYGQRPLRRAEYATLVEQGAFDGEHVELLPELSCR